MQAIFLEHMFSDIIVEVFRSITESGEYDNFMVIVVERMLYFIVNICKEKYVVIIIFNLHLCLNISLYQHYNI